ncbi:DegT/DnrJ/EryC1/StrS family aminotransferase [Kiloniella laminariae]|uniref:DegT/DnrJ/EryC1/StrS family aminotransferase n=1 Tax=Kiloniella laminariae TaxID=454162 RepID=UPI000365D4D3|nr:DegT/DnrJ/EryC1/StrS family aminotransferase [Kiloniella laminariae]
MTKNIPFSNIVATNTSLLGEYQKVLDRVCKSSQIVLGSEVSAFETEFADYIGVKHVVTVASGTDALILALKGLGIGAGDEVITVANSFLASASCIALSGASPIFADVRDDLNIDPESVSRKITSKTKAIIAVHLTGRPAAMAELKQLSLQHGLFLIEDAAQAVGAAIDGVKVGGIGDVGCFSFHPNKTLSALGDGGALSTDDDKLASYFRQARNHGLIHGDCEFWSVNSRLDELQAGFLRVKLPYLEKWNARRQFIAQYYKDHLNDYVSCPETQDNVTSVYHTYVIKTDQRDALFSYLMAKGIGCGIHYPTLTNDHSVCSAQKSVDIPVSSELVKKIISLPISESLTNKQIKSIVQEIQKFFQG